MIDNYGLDSVNVSLLKGDSDKQTSLLLVTPRWDASANFLNEWLGAQRSWLSEKMLTHGAIMVRGFDINSPADMEAAVRRFQPYLNNRYRGTSPRHTLGGTQFVFSAAEVPTNCKNQIFLLPLSMAHFLTLISLDQTTRSDPIAQHIEVRVRSFVVLL